MKNLFALLGLLALTTPAIAQASAKVMNPGEAYGQLVFLSEADVQGNSQKFKDLSPLSIPVFAELPMELSVVAGAITLKQQNLLSHVQIKSRARKTPNLDISGLEGGMQNPLLAAYTDGTWVHLLLGADESISIQPSTEAAATEFYQRNKPVDVKLVSDLTATQIFRSEELGSPDFVRVGSKAANYSELARTLNSPERTVVRTGYGLPFFYYQEFVDSNPAIKKAIERLLKDPLMNRISKVSYRAEKLAALQTLMNSEEAVVSPALIAKLMDILENTKNPAGQTRKMKFRSSTNSEDLPNFNGAGLYTSDAYNPFKKGVEKDRAAKEKSLAKTLRTVWSSVWNLRAYEERNYFRIPHIDVKMGIQINPSFANEGVDGVVVTKNVANRADLPGAGVYVEAQRGDKYSVANPEGGTKPERILVLIDEANPLNQEAYVIHVLQKSNVADDGETVLPTDNLNPIMTDAQVKDLVWQSKKAEAHFGPIFADGQPGFSLDIEFKVDSEETGAPAVYLKQARPYID